MFLYCTRKPAEDRENKTDRGLFAIYRLVIDSDEEIASDGAKNLPIKITNYLRKDKPQANLLFSPRLYLFA